MSEEFLRIAITELTTLRIATGDRSTMEIDIGEVKHWADLQVQNGAMDDRTRDVVSGLARVLMDAHRLDTAIAFSIPVAR